jgi:hypothetical protein
MATGGKPYYLAGLLPVLLGAGSVSVDRWLERGRITARRAAFGTAFALSAVVGATISLPVLPESDVDPVIAMNEDVGETIGWPELADTVGRVRREHSGAIVFTANYGEAGAVERYTGTTAYSGHNAFGDWGPPPSADDRAPVIVVGLAPQQMAAHMAGCRVVARITNDAGVENDEEGAPVMVCRSVRRPWKAEWPALRHLN